MGVFFCVCICVFVFVVDALQCVHEPSCTQTKTPSPPPSPPKKQPTQHSAGLLTSTYLDVQQVTNTKANYADSGVTPEQLAAVEALGASGNVFERLAASIAPEVCSSVFDCLFWCVCLVEREHVLHTR